MSAYQKIIRALEQAGRIVSLPAKPDSDITGVVDDSRHVQPGSLFCAIEGTTDDGHHYLPDARSRGAAAAIVTRRVDVAIPQIVVDAGRAAAAVAAAEWYDRPGDELDLIGVTGTNGKSTTVALIRHLLNEDATVGAVGTLGGFDGQGSAIYREGLTTPGVVGLQGALAELLKRGTDRVVMEVSSHALDQHRIDGLTFRAGAFTNVSRDHLDYHATFEEYLNAKLRLDRYIRPDGIQVVNFDDAAWRNLAEGERRRITFGRSEAADVWASEVQLKADMTCLGMHFGEKAVAARIPLVGEFNVSNSLAAAATAWGIGGEIDAIVDRLRSAPQVAGRMERLEADGLMIFRDYAHTPDALERAIAALRPLTPGRLIVLFGCGGDRDRGKRAVMGGIAGRGADVAIVTSDNPRTEDPARIIADIEEGIEGRAHVRIVDRREAIHRAVQMLREGDCLLLAGKGHETYQVVGSERRPFDEPAIVREAVGARGRA